MGPDDVGIISPVVNEQFALFPPGLRVEGEVGIDGGGATNVKEVWVKVLRINDAIPPDPKTDPNGGWQHVAPAGDNSFLVNNVTGAHTRPLSGSANNKLVAIPELIPGGYGPTKTVLFIGRPAKEEIVVSATHCMWFAFASTGVPGPGNGQGDFEPDTANHQPPFVAVPLNVSTLTVAGMGRWRHFPPQEGNDAVVSGADGRAPLTALENLQYQNETYNSDAIADGQFQVNSLIGMWGSATGPVGAPFLVGSGPVTRPVDPPDQIERVYFAFHDGQRWHNNSGFVVVTIDWGVAANFKYQLRRRGRKV